MNTQMVKSVTSDDKGILMTNEQLIQAAAEAKQFAYAPYSGFKVGAALLTEDGRVFTGCNIENASYGATNCAERTAIFKAVSEGATAFKRMALISESANFLSPCGICRQVMSEFCKPDMELLMCDKEGGYIIKTLGELFPEVFTM